MPAKQIPLADVPLPDGVVVRRLPDGPEYTHIDTWTPNTCPGHEKNAGCKINYAFDDRIGVVGVKTRFHIVSLDAPAVKVTDHVYAPELRKGMLHYTLFHEFSRAHRDPKGNQPMRLCEVHRHLPNEEASLVVDEENVRMNRVRGLVEVHLPKLLPLLELADEDGKRLWYDYVDGRLHVNLLDASHADKLALEKLVREEIKDVQGGKFQQHHHGRAHGEVVVAL